MSKAKPKPVDETPEVLAEYREQATTLEAALKAVRAVQKDIFSTTEARETALGARQTLIDKAAAADDEEAIQELSRLSSRGEVLQARLNSHATRLAVAEADLKALLATFAISFNALFWNLRTHILRDAANRITEMLHPSVRAIAAASVGEIAALTTEVVDLEPLAIRMEAGAAMFDSILPPENIERDAERALPKAAPLLAEASLRLLDGFIPPAAFDLNRWRESLNPPALAAAAA